jgi:hypothetical protein
LRIAVIGDVPGCVAEFEELLAHLEWCSVDEIWTVGDLVDRGPDSHGVIQLCRDKGVRSVMGNHDQSIIDHYERHLLSGQSPKNDDKAKTIKQLTPEDVDYLRRLPPLHVFDKLGLVVVHGGLWPGLALHQQPKNVIRAQLINPYRLYESRWWGPDAMEHRSQKSEEESRREGFERWYRLYDHSFDCIYGHSTWAQPMIHQNKGAGRTIGIDTGSCFGGSVTACIYGIDRNPSFLSVKAKELWFPAARRCFWEAD